MVSFDAVLLFINVPLSETIEIIANHFYPEDDPLLNQLPFKKEVFKKLMFCAAQGLFMNKDPLHKQINGVTMGSLLEPTIANFCTTSGQGPGELPSFWGSMVIRHAPSLGSSNNNYIKLHKSRKLIGYSTNNFVFAERIVEFLVDRAI